MFLFQVSHPEITYEIDLPDEKVMTLCDRRLMSQAVTNLAKNATEAIDAEAGNSKRVDFAGKISARVRSGQGRYSIEVIDNGVGIPQENLSKVFRHGFTTKKDGHGFGLHSSALAAKEMDGSLTGQSDGPGHGATFIFELPLKPKEVVRYDI